MQPSRTIADLPRSGIREIFELALQKSDTIHLEVGEPSFATPEHVLAAADAAARAGHTTYTPNAGIPELRDALAEKVRTRNGIDADRDRVIVTPGAVAGIYSALLAVSDPGDEVLLSDPCWPNYVLMSRLNNVTARRFPLLADNAMIPRAEQIEPHITDRTRAIIVNTPGNPTGAVVTEDVGRELLALAQHYDLWVLSDEVYDEIWFDEPPYSLARLDTDGRVISFFSFSKTYAMTGWRVGYLVAPEPLAEPIIRAQEPITSCVNAPAQHAAIAAVTGPQEFVTRYRDEYRHRRDLVAGILDDAGVRYVRPGGAFYMMVDVSSSGLDATTFARRLVSERGVAVVPGAAFGLGSDAFVRLSLATETETLAEGARRLAEAATG